MSAINDCDVILANAAARYEPVMLPPAVIVPPGQLGSGSLPGRVTGADGTDIVSTNVLRSSVVYVDQIKDTAGNLMFESGLLARERVAGLGALAGKDTVLPSEVPGLGSLALLDRVTTNLVTGLGPFATRSDIPAASVTGLGTLATRNGVNAATGEVAGLGGLAYKAQVFANELGVGTLAAGVVYAGTIAAERVVGGSFEGKTFSGGTFNGVQFNGGGISGTVVNGTGVYSETVLSGQTLFVNQSVSGNAFSGFIRSNQRWWANFTDGGTTRAVVIELTSRA